MCGFVGYFPNRESKAETLVRLRTMTDSLRHRGPNGEGYWIDSRGQVAFGHRRLSIIDLSQEGAQPMTSRNRLFTISYNGEIYNFLELRRELEREGVAFRGRSDTEILLNAVETWGLSKSLEKVVGMFAFALWDERKQKLTLVRDRLGEKPLYYGWVNGVFYFGSELKAFKAHPQWDGEIDRNALALFLRHNYIPTPYSIYRGIKKLPAGSLLDIKPEEKNQFPIPIPYWSAKEVLIEGIENPFQGSLAEAEEELESALTKTVRNQMISDVPLGAFLSGGIDSSLIVSLMQNISPII